MIEPVAVFSRSGPYRVEYGPMKVARLNNYKTVNVKDIVYLWPLAILMKQQSITDTNEHQHVNRPSLS